MDEVTGEAPDAVEATDQPVEVTPEAESFTDVNLTEAPEGGPTAEWLQERYKQMQADYTRKTQGISETAKQREEELQFLESLRSDRETQQAVLEELSQLLGESEGDEEYDDEEESNPLETRLAQLEQERATEKAAALSQQITSHIEQLAKDAGVELDEDDVRSVFDRATSGAIGKAETEAAFKAFHAREQARQLKWQKAYLASKQAPTQVPAGTSASDTPDLNDRDTRLRRFAAILQSGD